MRKAIANNEPKIPPSKIDEGIEQIKDFNLGTLKFAISFALFPDAKKTVETIENPKITEKAIHIGRK